MKDKHQLDFDLIKKICGQELSFRLQGTIRNMNDSTMKIVNTGMVSSGKSSLYNLLTDHAETERFPTGAARTTTNADICTYKNMVYVDTPGIDVRDDDDDIAYHTIMESDIILMIHNIKTGPLTRSEFDWLHRIAVGMSNAEMCKHRIIFVCTWKDTREHDPDYNDIIEEVKRMTFEAVGTEIPFFDVSTKKYLDGIRKGKPILCERSGISELKTFVETSAAQYINLKKQFARDKFLQVAGEVQSSLSNSLYEQRQKVEQQEYAVKQKYTSQRNSWSGVYTYFKRQRETADKLKQELNNI